MGKGKDGVRQKGKGCKLLSIVNGEEEIGKRKGGMNGQVRGRG